MLLVACSSDSSADTDTDASSSSSGEASSSSSSTGEALFCEADTTIPLGAPVMADGEIGPLEWAGAAVITIPVEAREVNIIASHDGENLNFGFQPLSEGGLVIFPELYIDPLNDKSAMFAADDWWFHTDNQECGANGAFDTWPDCVEDNPDWQSTPGTAGPANVVEYSIPLSLLGIDPTERCEIGLALRVTNTQTVAEIWPSDARRDEPVTWATVALEVPS